MKVILIGGGKLVYFLVRQFASKGYHLTIINQDAVEAKALSRQLKATVILGDGSDPGMLKEAGAYQTDIVLSLTPHDQDNLVACQIAQKRYGVPRTIALVNDPDYQEVFQQLGVTVAFSATQILASLIEQRAGFEDIETLIPAAEGRVSVTEITLHEASPAVGQTLQALELPTGALVGCIVRDGQVIVPRGWSRLQAADRLILICQPEDYGQFLSQLTGAAG